MNEAASPGWVAVRRAVKTFLEGLFEYGEVLNVGAQRHKAAGKCHDFIAFDGSWYQNSGDHLNFEKRTQTTLQESENERTSYGFYPFDAEDDGDGDLFVRKLPSSNIIDFVWYDSRRLLRT